MIRYTVEDLLDYTEDEIWEIPTPKVVELELQDGEIIILNTCDLQISWYFWQVSVNYREIPIGKNLVIQGEVFSDDLVRKMMWNAIEGTIDMPIDKEDVWYLVYSQIYNKIFNAIASRLLAYVTGTDATHITEIIYDEQVYTANNAVTERMSTIDFAHAELKSVLTSNRYQRNPIVRAAKNRTVKLEQLLQSFGPKGKATDIDSVMYKIPIMQGFAHGLQGIGAYNKETRSGSKALLFNKDQVARTEYSSRKVQLNCSNILRIIPGDCGTHDTHSWYVPNSPLGKKLIKGLAGLHQVTNGKLREIRENDDFLLGTTVNFRSTLTCLHGHDQAVCEKCYGQLSYAITHDSNPGHVSGTEIWEFITQNVISTKHLDFIIYVFIATLLGKMTRYFTVKEDSPDTLFISQNIIKSNERLIIAFNKDEAGKLVDAMYVTNLGNINPVDTSALSYIDIWTVLPDGEIPEIDKIELIQKATSASLSNEFLKYIKNHSELLTVEGSRYVMDITEWAKSHHKEPFLIYPEKVESMADHGRRVEVFIRSAKNTSEDDVGVIEKRKLKRLPMLINYSNVDDALKDAFLLITEKIPNMLICHIATLLQSSRAVDPFKHDWRMPNGLKEGRFMSHDEMIRNRSLGPALLYQNQIDTFNDIKSYTRGNRLYNNLDSLFVNPK